MADRLRTRLKQFRQDRNLTQADLAVMAQVSRKTVNTIENEVFMPSTLLALKLARILDVEVEALFYLEET